MSRRFVVAAVVVGLALSACSEPRTAHRAPNVSHGAVSPAASATASSAAAVDSMLAGLKVGDTVPTAVLRQGLMAAVTEAGSWRTSFDDIWPAVAEQVLSQDGESAVRITGMEEDDPESETRIIGDEEYHRQKHAGQGFWECASRNDDNPLTRLPATAFIAARDIGSPLVLVREIVDGTATVLEQTSDTTTLQLQLSYDTVARMTGAAAGDPVHPPVNPPGATRLVLRGGLPVLFRTDYGAEVETEFRFTGWGRTGPIRRPPAKLVRPTEYSQIRGACH